VALAQLCVQRRSPNPLDFPGFGSPVYAACEGTFVRVQDRQRDHRSRTSPAGLLYLFTVELLREFVGVNGIFGNHVIIERVDGTYVALAHLRRRSVRCAPGERVAVGEAIAECGNSGNSSEPHLHRQVMDHRWPFVAAGLLFRLIEGDGVPIETPPNDGHLATWRPRCGSFPPNSTEIRKWS
jgi:murein DD-endopeptidase MepM/ murein hydrolase activator NlpD